MPERGRFSCIWLRNFSIFLRISSSELQNILASSWQMFFYMHLCIVGSHEQAHISFQWTTSPAWLLREGSWSERTPNYQYTVRAEDEITKHHFESTIPIIMRNKPVIHHLPVLLLSHSTHPPPTPSCFVSNNKLTIGGTFEALLRKHQTTIGRP